MKWKVLRRFYPMHVNVNRIGHHLVKDRFDFSEVLFNMIGDLLDAFLTLWRLPLGGRAVPVYIIRHRLRCAASAERLRKR